MFAFFFKKKKKCRENRLHAIPQIPEVARPLNSDSLTSPTRMVRKSSINIIQILWVFIESGITILTKQCSQNCTTTNLKNRFSCIGKYRNYVRFILYLHRWFRRQKPSSGRMTIENWIFKKQKKKKANIRRIVDILEVYHFFFSFLFLYIENSAFRENHNYICKRSDCVWKKKNWLSYYTCKLLLSALLYYKAGLYIGSSCKSEECAAFRRIINNKKIKIKNRG